MCDPSWSVPASSTPCNHTRAKPVPVCHRQKCGAETHSRSQVSRTRSKIATRGIDRCIRACRGVAWCVRALSASAGLHRLRRGGGVGAGPGITVVRTWPWKAVAAGDRLVRGWRLHHGQHGGCGRGALAFMSDDRVQQPLVPSTMSFTETVPSHVADRLKPLDWSAHIGPRHRHRRMARAQGATAIAGHDLEDMHKAMAQVSRVLPKVACVSSMRVEARVRRAIRNVSVTPAPCSTGVWSAVLSVGTVLEEQGMQCWVDDRASWSGDADGTALSHTTVQAGTAPATKLSLEPIRIIVPQSAGGSKTSLARVITQR